jgi:hypothetical protein
MRVRFYSATAATLNPAAADFPGYLVPTLNPPPKQVFLDHVGGLKSVGWNAASPQFSTNPGAQASIMDVAMPAYISYCRVQSWGDAENNVTLAVTQANPEAAPVSRLTIFIADVHDPTLGDAFDLPLSEAGTFTYAHSCDMATRYYYWARFYSLDGSPSETQFLGSFDKQSGATQLLNSDMTMGMTAGGKGDPGGPSPCVRILLGTPIQILF